MYKTWGGFEIPKAFHVDLQMLYQVDGLEKSCMDVMAIELISDHYKKMKSDFPSNQHDFWEESPLDELNLHYAGVDGYVSYKIYRKIKKITVGLQLPPTYCPGC